MSQKFSVFTVTVLLIILRYYILYNTAMYAG